MPMMHELPRRVSKDIWEEHWEDIMQSSWTVDIKQMRTLITKRCLAVLRQVITNNALNN